MNFLNYDLSNFNYGTGKIYSSIKKFIKWKYLNSKIVFKNKLTILMIKLIYF